MYKTYKRNTRRFNTNYGKYFFHTYPTKILLLSRIIILSLIK